MIKYWVIPPWLPIFLIGILVNVSTAVLSNQLFWWLTLGLGDFPRFYLLLVGPSLDPVTRESRRFLLIQNTQPTAQGKGHTQLKEAGKEGKKIKNKNKRPAGSFHAPADRHFYVKLLECHIPAATLQPYSRRVHITCFPSELTFPRALASLMCCWKTERQESLQVLEKTRQSLTEMSTANGNGDQEAVRHSPCCRKQPVMFISGINAHFRNFVSQIELLPMSIWLEVAGNLGVHWQREKTLPSKISFFRWKSAFWPQLWHERGFVSITEVLLFLPRLLLNLKKKKKK